MTILYYITLTLVILGALTGIISIGLYTKLCE